MKKKLNSNQFSDASNNESLSDLRWILSNADNGFYMFTASPLIQQKVLNYLSSEDMAIYDYSKTDERSYSYRVINQWAAHNSEKAVYAIINLQLALPEDKDIQNLNLSRDILSQHNRIWIFGMTEDTRYRILKHAPDFYSFVRVKNRFVEEIKSVRQDYIIYYDSCNNFTFAQEAQDYLKSYEAMENEYMNYDINSDNLSREKLLSSALTLENIANAHVYMCNYPKALLCLQKCLTIREKFLGEKHPDTATAYNNIAGIYHYQGDYTTALLWDEKALAIREHVLGSEHPDTLTTHNNIAGIYRDQGNYATALLFYKKSLTIREKIYGKEHPKTANTYNNIAIVFRYQGDYETALSWHIKALTIREKMLGPEHPRTATTYNDIACLYKDQGEYSTALSWYHRALEIREHVLGKDHLNTAVIYNNIAMVCNNQGDYPKALSFYNKAKEIFEKWLGKEHPDTANINCNIAKVNEIIAENIL